MAGIMEKGRTRYPQQTIDEARRLYALGMNCTVIANKLGVCGDVVVRRWCDEEYRLAYNERAKLRARGEIQSRRYHENWKSRP